MVVFIVTMVLGFVIDSFLVGITFYAIKNRFKWNISYRTGFIILFLVFVFLDNYWLPMVHVLDLTYTVGNQEIAKFFDLAPMSPLKTHGNIGTNAAITVTACKTVVALPIRLGSIYTSPISI